MSAPGQDFLGAEFLLWLWFRAETQGGTYPRAAAGGNASVAVVLDGLLEMESPGGGDPIILKGEALTRRPEAQAALASGRLPRRARLLLAYSSLTFEVTLEAAALDLGSIKVAADAADALPHGAEADQERAELLFELSDVLDGLYREFLLRRRADVPAMRPWLADRRSPGAARLARSARVPAGP